MTLLFWGEIAAGCWFRVGVSGEMCRGSGGPCHYAAGGLSCSITSEEVNKEVASTLNIH